jgi:hypothetical protein
MFILQQNWRKGQNRFCLEMREVGGEGLVVRQWREMAQTVYAHMNEWIKKKKGWLLDEYFPQTIFNSNKPLIPQNLERWLTISWLFYIYLIYCKRFCFKKLNKCYILWDKIPLLKLYFIGWLIYSTRFWNECLVFARKELYLLNYASSQR